MSGAAEMGTDLTARISRAASWASFVTDGINRHTRALAQRLVEEEAAKYDRGERLPYLLPFLPPEYHGDFSPAATELVIERLKASYEAARGQVHRGNFYRCIELRGAILAESRRLAALTSPQGGPAHA